MQSSTAKFGTKGNSVATPAKCFSSPSTIGSTYSSANITFTNNEAGAFGVARIIKQASGMPGGKAAKFFGCGKGAQITRSASSFSKEALVKLEKSILICSSRVCW